MRAGDVRFCPVPVCVCVCTSDCAFACYVVLYRGGGCHLRGAWKAGGPPLHPWLHCVVFLGQQCEPRMDDTGHRVHIYHAPLTPCSQQSLASDVSWRWLTRMPSSVEQHVRHPRHNAAGVGTGHVRVVEIVPVASPEVLSICSVVTAAHATSVVLSHNPRTRFVTTPCRT